MFHLFAAESEKASPHVSLPAEQIFTIAGFPITNSWFTGIFGTALVIWMFFYVAGKVKRDEKNRFVSLIQWIFEGLYGTVEQAIGDKQLARKIAPLSITMFFFILINYWVGILPIVGSITVDGIPVFRSLIADLNVTFALAIITIVMAQVYAVGAHGIFGNLGRYFRNPAKDPAGAFEGILELVAEFSRLVGLSLRLFGNVFAGEVLLMMIAFMTIYAMPIALPPFYIFELFIGAVQAYIFFMLTTVFISLGLVSHGHAEHVTDHNLPDTRRDSAVPAGNGQ
jgi:F-type H+-transporting ATPase subunit a